MIKLNSKRTATVVVFMIIDLAVVFGCSVLSLLITGNDVTFDLHVWLWIVVNAVSTLLFFSLFGLYRMLYRFAGVTEAFKILLATGLVFICSFIFSCVDEPVTLREAVTFSLLQFITVGIIRFAKRAFGAAGYYIKKIEGKATRAIIIGGGSAGTVLIREMQTTDKVNYVPVCVLDDDEDKHGTKINGVKVFGKTTDIEAAVKKYRPDEIIIAMPSVPKKEIKRVLELCRPTKCKVKTLPGAYQILTGEAKISDLKDVEITDLLGREQVKVNLDEIMGYIEGCIVLVTGGGGSIGSELCRQIATHNPKQLIILDIYENNAYDIEQELKRFHPELNLLALIASVRDYGKMEDVFRRYKPEIVFNAAAHKHVPLMETSPNEAVKNNIFGTLNTAKLADKYAVKTFVQISTDKAVNPTNVMGATKRVCEMIIQTLGRHSKYTKFVAVRFGNVLGSNGSVIPLFKQQIKEGGPVTVTHKDIIRYFMTIPEAVSLVLQAGAYAQEGQIFVLDMGEPVKIYDLAVNLIKLSGLEPGVDIEIKCTGLRPGEKLYEERLMDEEGLQTTPNGLINIANPIDIDEGYLWTMLDKLYKAAYSESPDMKSLVAELVPTYKVDDNK